MKEVLRAFIDGIMIGVPTIAGTICTHYTDNVIWFGVGVLITFVLIVAYVIRVMRY